jgi:hypothetical protein
MTMVRLGLRHMLRQLICQYTAQTPLAFFTAHSLRSFETQRTQNNFYFCFSLRGRKTKKLYPAARKTLQYG